MRAPHPSLDGEQPEPSTSRTRGPARDLSERLPAMTVEQVRSYLSRRARIGRRTVDRLLSDPRNAVRAMGAIFRARLRVEARERRRLQRLCGIERDLYAQGVERVVGVDEAGRAPFAGPVVAAAVVLRPDARIRELDDSKRLDEPTRERLYDEVREAAVDWAVGIASPAAIDAVNIYHASVAAMRLAVAGLEPGSFAILVDGRRIRDFPWPHTAIVGGDGRCRSIAAASVVAKVTRDRLMRSLHGAYPAYRFDANKGYGTADHLRGIRSSGLSPYHRRTFAPVWDLGEAGSAEFRLWQEEILACEDVERLHEMEHDVRSLAGTMLAREMRTIERLLRVASARLEG
ncbi:MAG: ribonuclease HII [Gemmatimonadetes bacterium]|nr:ribonuclease HII [Gemmatimonadota bacterium]